MIAPFLEPSNKQSLRQPLTAVGIDPGERTGFVLVTVSFDDKTVTIERSMIIPDGIEGVTNSKHIVSNDVINATYCVCETWVNYAGLDSNIVNQVIGAFYFLRGKSPFYLTQPNERNLARAVFKYAKPSHDPDNLSALLHVLSFLLRKKIIDPTFTIQN